MKMTACISLFRGINVGGNRIVPMSELKSLHESLGLKDVVTYIQSGNVVFTSDEADPAQLSKLIEESFAQKFGFRSQVMVRTSAELEEIIANNPFQNQPEKEPKRVLALFLATRPESTALEDLKKTYNGPEEIYLVGQELFVYYSDGVGRSKLTLPLIEKKLKTVGTGRNWNTVLRLQQMMLR
jgi:uncharacterized protein (DUF1697 family)